MCVCVFFLSVRIRTENLRNVSRTVTSLHVLFCVLPNQDGATDMNVERSNDTKLRNLDAFVQHLNELNRDAFPFIADREYQAEKDESE